MHLHGNTSVIFNGLKHATKFSGKALEFLGKLAQKNAGSPSRLDLSGYALLGKQILQVLKSFPIDGVQELDISGNLKVTKEDLLGILSRTTGLVYLDLVSNSLSNEDVKVILEKRPTVLSQFRAVIHPWFTNPKQTFTTSLTLASGSGALPLPSLNSAVHMIWNFLDFALNHKDLTYYPGAGRYKLGFYARVC